MAGNNRHKLYANTTESKEQEMKGRDHNGCPRRSRWVGRHSGAALRAQSLSLPYQIIGWRDYVPRGSACAHVTSSFLCHTDMIVRNDFH